MVQVVVNKNTIALTKEAAELLNASPGSRISIKLIKKDNRMLPVIGTDEAFECPGGNLLTKKLTISFRSKVSSVLKAYGTEFTLAASDMPGIFYLENEFENVDTDEDDFDFSNVEESVDSIENLYSNNLNL